MKIIRFTEANMRNYEEFLTKHELCYHLRIYPTHLYVSLKTYKKMKSIKRILHKKHYKYRSSKEISTITANYMLNCAPSICDGLEYGKMLIDTVALSKAKNKAKNHK
jgi:hypothetical protein